MTTFKFRLFAIKPLLIVTLVLIKIQKGIFQKLGSRTMVDESCWSESGGTTRRQF